MAATNLILFLFYPLSQRILGYKQLPTLHIGGGGVLPLKKPHKIQSLGVKPNYISRIQQS